MKDSGCLSRSECTRESTMFIFNVYSHACVITSQPYTVHLQTAGRWILAWLLSLLWACLHAADLHHPFSQPAMFISAEWRMSDCFDYFLVYLVIIVWHMSYGKLRQECTIYHNSWVRRGNEWAYGSCSAGAAGPRPNSPYRGNQNWNPLSRACNSSISLLHVLPLSSCKLNWAELRLDVRTMYGTTVHVSSCTESA